MKEEPKDTRGWCAAYAAKITPEQCRAYRGANGKGHHGKFSIVKYRRRNGSCRKCPGLAPLDGSGKEARQ